MVVAELASRTSWRVRTRLVGVYFVFLHTTLLQALQQMRHFRKNRACYLQAHDGNSALASLQRCCSHNLPGAFVQQQKMAVEVPSYTLSLRVRRTCKLETPHAVELGCFMKRPRRYITRISNLSTILYKNRSKTCQTISQPCLQHPVRMPPDHTP